MTCESRICNRQSCNPDHQRLTVVAANKIRQRSSSISLGTGIVNRVKYVGLTGLPLTTFLVSLAELRDFVPTPLCELERESCSPCGMAILLPRLRDQHRFLAVADTRAGPRQVGAGCPCLLRDIKGEALG